MNLGRFIIATGTIPAGSDGEVLARLMDAGEKPIEVQYVQWYGGDTAEFAQLHLLPPAILGGSPALSLTPADIPGSIAVTPHDYMTGGVWAAASPQALGADAGARGAPRFNKFVIPPWYSLAVNADTTNAAAWVVTVGGFQLDA